MHILKDSSFTVADNISSPIIFLEILFGFWMS